MNNKRIIALIGNIGSGKNTVGDFIEDKFKYEKESFAKPLKDIISSLFNLDRDLLEGDTKASRKYRECKLNYWSHKLGYDVNARKLMTTMATDVISNNFNKSVWAYSLQERILQEPNKGIVITDCRFIEEIDVLKNLGATFIYVIRKDEPDFIKYVRHCLQNNEELPLTSGGNYLIFKKNTYHKSEWNFLLREDCINHVVNNDDTIESLHNKISNIMV